MIGSKQARTSAGKKPDQLAVDTATRTRTRNRILDATSQLLTAGEPLARLSINRIATTAGVSRAAFYLHFSSKHDLIAKLAQRETNPLIEMAGPALNGGLITRGDLVQVAQSAVAVYRTNRGVLSGILELAEYDDDTREAWRETIYRIAKLFQVAIANLRPELTENRTAQLAKMIVWSGERFLHQEVSDSPPDSDEEKVWALVEMAWKLMND